MAALQGDLGTELACAPAALALGMSPWAWPVGEFVQCSGANVHMPCRISYDDGAVSENSRHDSLPSTSEAVSLGLCCPYLVYCASFCQYHPSMADSSPSLEQYERIGTIGRGSFGTVAKICRKSDGRVCVSFTLLEVEATLQFLGGAVQLMK